MAKREKIKETEDREQSYFTKQEKDVAMFSSGCTLLDQVLGGGWAVGRVSNIIGNRSAGKTLLAIEACSNFVEKYKKATIYYIEAESAFDVSYAEALGLPVKSVKFGTDHNLGVADNCSTVEGLFEYLEKVIEQQIENNDDTPALVVIDSLDAFSDRKEQAMDIDQGTYGAAKAKQLSQMFRRLITKLENSKVSLMFISQIRDKIGATMGEKTSRSGGKALDFYCSQVIRIAEIGKLKKTSKGVERPVGVKVKAKCQKNKVGLPFRECEYEIIFGYGINDIKASIDWMQQVKYEVPFDELGLEKQTKIAISNFCKSMLSCDFDEYDRVKQITDRHVIKHWETIEEGFLPKRGKYRGAI